MMPMLPPRLRIRLRIALPWVRMWRGSVDSATMSSGTWVQPRPNPALRRQSGCVSAPWCGQQLPKASEETVSDDTPDAGCRTKNIEHQASEREIHYEASDASFDS